jgi:adenylate cyclase class 2
MLTRRHIGNTLGLRFYTETESCGRARLYSAMSATRPATRETEVKIRVADIAALILRLRALGARSQGRVLEQNTLYDTLDSDFRRARRLLRVSVETPSGSKSIPGGLRRTIITSKTPARRSIGGRYKENLEREELVRSPGRLDAVLRSLGLRPGFRYEKYRTSFTQPGLHLDLDETPVGVFLELEGVPQSIDRAARALGFSPRDYLRATYWDLNVAECRRAGRKPGNMLLPS